jgi:hypothetical protein
VSPHVPLLVASLAALSMPARAEETSAAGTAPVSINDARIGDTAGHHASGRIAINQAAGTGNAQANLAAIALTPDGLGVIGLQSRQAVFAGDRNRDASARIDGGALRGSDGLLSINQVAGAGNAQANVIGIGQGSAGLAGLLLAQGVAGLEDAALASIAGDAPAEGTTTATPLREAVITGDALRDSRGVVQINQTAGVGNRSANAIVLLLPGGSP